MSQEKPRRLCPTCNDEDLEVVKVSPTRSFTLCTKNEMSGRDYFKHEESDEDAKINALIKLIYMRRINTGAILNDYRKLHPKNSKKDAAETSFYEGKIEAYERCLQTILEIFEIKEMPIIDPISLRENPET